MTSDIHSWGWISYQQLFAFSVPKKPERDGNSRMQVWNNDVIKFLSWHVSMEKEMLLLSTIIRQATISKDCASLSDMWYVYGL